MSSVSKKGKVWYMALRGPGRGWVRKSTGQKYKAAAEDVCDAEQRKLTLGITKIVR